MATIDFEATALSVEADVIEVGIAIYDRDQTIKTWSSLVRPSDDCRWTKTAAAVHNISRSELENAPLPSAVAADLNRLMAGIEYACCDGYKYDSKWMARLFEAAAIEPVFKIEPLELLPRHHMRVVRHFMEDYFERTPTEHRAGADALRIMQAYAYAIGKNPDVVHIA